MADEEVLRRFAATTRNAAYGAERDIFGQLSLNGLRICGTCLGPLSNQTYSECFPCGKQALYPVPSIYFLTYSGATPQSVTDMAAYKGPQPAPNAVARLSALLYIGLRYHFPCIDEAAGGIDVMTYVPSGKTPNSAIPSILPGTRFPRAEMRYLPPYRGIDERSQWFEVDKFEADPQDFSGKGVLLIEDSWFKGYNARSAAAALYKAGARHVSILVLARRLGADFTGQGEILEKMTKSQSYDPRFCPVSFDFHD